MNLKFWKKIKIKGKSTIIDKVVVFVAEFFATTIFLFVGCLGTTFSRKVLDPSLCFGLGVMIAIQCFGHISGAHVNPLLTFAAVILGRVSLLDSLLYLLAQILGALLGYGFLFVLLDDEYRSGPERVSDSSPCCTGTLNSLLTETQGIFIEFLISFLLVLVICGIWDNRNKNKSDSIALRFGFTILGLAVAAGPFTGAHMNPVRTLAPVLITDTYKNVHIYLAGAIPGGIVAALLYAIIFAEADAEEAPSEEEAKA